MTQNKKLSAFAKNLRAARKMRGWTQKQAAEQIQHVTRNAYSKWENGEREPPLEILVRISEVYQINDLKAFIAA